MLFFISFKIYLGIGFSLVDLFNFEEYNPLVTIIRSVLIYLYIPLAPFFLKFTFKDSRISYFSKLKKNYLKVLILILIFIFLTSIINITFDLDAADGYQEEEIFCFFNLGLWLLYIVCFTFIYLKYLKNDTSTLNFRVLFFRTSFYISFTITLISLINITSCDDHPGMFALLSVFSLIFCTLISLVDLIISFFKNSFNYILLIYPLLFAGSFYGFFLFAEIYGNDGKCNLIFGPDESGMTLTFMLIALYSFISQKTHLSISSTNKNNEKN